MIKQLKLSALVATMLISVGAYAQQAPKGYVVDQSENSVVRNNYGECWRTEYRDSDRYDCDAKAPEPEEVVDVQRVTLSADVLFDFDKSTLRATAREELDPLANSLRGDNTLRSIKITGHTDPIGTERYNLALSERRAEAVMQYLVAAGLPAEKMTAVGVGKTEPSGLAAHCVGKKFRNKAERNACYQPDRRVVLDITKVRTVVTTQ